MTTIHHRYESKASPEQLWHSLSDLTLVETYNPTVKKAHLQGGQKEGVGTIRACDLKPKGKIVERVTVWEQGKAVGLEIVESDWPISRMQWVTRIDPQGAGSVLSQRLDYDMKFGPLGWILNILVLKRNIQKNVGEALAGLIELAEQGN
jgi:Polyketide cyclase / dehydrase and lipid transport